MVNAYQIVGSLQYSDILEGIAILNHSLCMYIVVTKLRWWCILNVEGVFYEISVG